MRRRGYDPPSSILDLRPRSSIETAMHRMNLSAPGISRREMLCRCANGFGGLALATLLAEKLDAAGTNPLAQRPPHYAPKAKSVIFLFMKWS